MFDIYIMSMKTVTDGCTLMDLLYVCQETRCFELKKKRKKKKREGEPGFLLTSGFPDVIWEWV